MPLKQAKMHFNNFEYLALYQGDGSNMVCKKIPIYKKLSSTFQKRLTHYMVFEDRLKTRYCVLLYALYAGRQQSKTLLLMASLHDDKVKPAVSEKTRFIRLMSTVKLIRNEVGGWQVGRLLQPSTQQPCVVLRRTQYSLTG